MFYPFETTRQESDVKINSRTRAFARQARVAHSQNRGVILTSSTYNAAHHWFTVSAYFTRVVQGVNALQPTANLVITAVAHMGLGALLLAITAVLTIQTYRYSGQPAQVLPFDRNRQVATA